MNILQGHCLDLLKTLKPKSVHLVVISPPYWRKRNYGTVPQIWDAKPLCDHKWKEVTVAKTSGPSTPDSRSSNRANSATKEDSTSHFCTNCNAWKGELGQEPTPKLFLRHLCQIIRQIHRVLRDDGTFWLNIDDSQSASGHGWGGGSKSEKLDLCKKSGGYKGRKAPGCWKLKPKDMCLIPERLAIACQDMGWYIRRRIIWHKPNPMPESVEDRPSSAHEIIWMLSKREKYFFDADAIKEPVKLDTLARAYRARGDSKYVEGAPGQNAQTCKQPKENGILDKPISAMANKKDVWTINVSNFKDSHFATFPTEIPSLCIKAGTSAYGCCKNCGAPYTRILEKGEADLDAQKACGGDLLGSYDGKATKDYTKAGAQDPSEVKARILAGMVLKKTVGWESTCKCFGGKNTIPAEAPRPDFVVPCMVLDCFSGSGTTGEVAQELGRDFTGIELGEQYHPMINRRTAQKGLALTV